jgi:hypothetical protein
MCVSVLQLRGMTQCNHVRELLRSTRCADANRRSGNQRRCVKVIRGRRISVSTMVDASEDSGDYQYKKTYTMDNTRIRIQSFIVSSSLVRTLLGRVASSAMDSANAHVGPH